MKDRKTFSYGFFKKPKASWLGPLAIGAILIYLVIPPFLFLIHTSFLPGYFFSGEEGYTLEHYREVLSSASTAKLFSHHLSKNRKRKFLKQRKENSKLNS